MLQRIEVVNRAPGLAALEIHCSSRNLKSGGMTLKWE